MISGCTAADSARTRPTEHGLPCAQRPLYTASAESAAVQPLIIYAEAWLPLLLANGITCLGCSHSMQSFRPVNEVCSLYATCSARAKHSCFYAPCPARSRPQARWM